jgi:tetratricopeptide (TPR) repeat protein
VAGDQTKFQQAMIYAERFSGQDNWAEAIKAYRFALAEFPNNEAAIIGFGRANLSLGQTEIAWKAFQQVLRVNPANYQVLGYMAEIQENTGQIDAAAETYLRIGNIFASQNDAEAAIDVWLHAINLVPDKVDAHYKLAQILAQQGQKLDAARQLLTLAKIFQERSDETQAYHQLEEAKSMLPNDLGVQAAFEALEQGLIIDPDRIGEQPEPQANFEPVFDDEPLWSDDPFAIPDTATVSASTGGLIEMAQQKALQQLADAIFEDDQQPVAATMPREQIILLMMQAIDLQRQEKFTEAVNIYRQITQAGAGRPALYFNMGVLYQKQGQLNDAAKMFKMAAQDKSYKMASEFLLGKTYYKANNLEQTYRHLLEAIKIIDLQQVVGQQSEKLAQAYDDLLSSRLAQPDAQKADSFVTTLDRFFTNPAWQQKAMESRALMDNAVEDGSGVMSLAEFLETPETEVVITSMSLTAEYVKRNFLLTASEECLRAIQYVPSYLPLHVRLGEILLKQDHINESISKFLYVARVYEMRQQPDQAVNTYQKILRVASMDVTVRTKLIEMYMAAKNLEPALEQYLILADSYYQLAQVDRALERYNEALRLAATSPNQDTWRAEILSRMGDIYNQRFDWARAASAYEELLKITPNDERLQRQLIDLYYKQNKLSQATKILDVTLSNYQRYNPLKALDLLKELVSVHQEDMSLRQRLAVAYVQNGMIPEAIAEYDVLGEMQLEKGLRSQAVQTIQAIINLGPADMEGYRRLLAQISGGAV